MYVIFWHNKLADSVRTCYCREQAESEEELQEELKRLRGLKYPPEEIHVFKGKDRIKV